MCRGFSWPEHSHGEWIGVTRVAFGGTSTILRRQRRCCPVLRCAWREMDVRSLSTSGPGARGPIDVCCRVLRFAEVA